MLHAAADPGLPNDAAQAALQRVLRALDLRHPAAMDAAVNGALAPLRGGAKQRGGRSGTEGGDSSSGSEEVRVCALCALICGAQGVLFIVCTCMGLCL